MGRAGSTSPGRNVSAIMRQVRSQGTAPELVFQRAMSERGVKFAPTTLSLPGKPDFVIEAKRFAIFIDGDFWHGGQWQRRNLTALEEQFEKTNSRKYWLAKIRRNMARDSVSTAQLLSMGWTVLRFWESAIRTSLEECVQLTMDFLDNGAEPDIFAHLPKKTVAEFFAGIGLMRMGLERQGWAVDFANDIDEHKYEMYKGHFHDAEKHFIVDDIHKLSVDAIPTVSLATASFPCNDLSLAGARNGLSGKESSAFWGLVTILEKMENQRPPLLLIENVTGFLTSHKGQDFREALVALNNLGYVVDAFILDAAHFVPQSRQRLFIVGVRELEGTPFQLPHHSKPSVTELRPKALVDFVVKNPDIKWNLRSLPLLPTKSARLASILESNEEVEWWESERAKYLLNQMSPRHRAIAEQMMAGSEWSYGTVFRRMRNGKSMAELRTDGIAGCLRTPRGGSGRQILFRAGKGQYNARLISPREAARLMGADDYTISVALNQALFGFGDAVCVPAIEWIAEYYLNPLVNELMRGQLLKLQLQETYS